MKILIMNVGSTTLKFKLYQMPEEKILTRGAVEGIGQPVSRYQFQVEGGTSTKGEESIAGYMGAIEKIITYLLSSQCGQLRDLKELGAVGFKTVHAKNIIGAEILNEEVLSAMEDYILLAPSHNPPYIEAIRTFKKALPETPMVGLFEPTFHRTMPEYAWRYAVPFDWVEKYGIRRYGFHGASHRYIAEKVPHFFRKTGKDSECSRIISCHLGGSSSICAIRDGKSIDTSMGFTPQSGILSSTRPHDIDPFIPLYLIERAKMSVKQVVDVLCKESGLKALSGVSGEMRDIVEAAGKGNPRAQLAIDAFVYGVKKCVGSYVAALGGVDVLVFTGGIGERSAEIRAGVCEGLKCMGIQLDEKKNQSSQPDCEIGAEDSGARVLALVTNEELIVARATYEKLEKEKK